MVSCQSVADYFLAQQDEEAGDTLSNLKLQKLLYYAQGFHLAMYGVPLFNEPIEAWTHGPVIVSIYHKYKAYGSGSIPVPTAAECDELTPEQKELLDEVQNVYGQFSAWKLREMAHNEPPWANATIGMPISHQALTDYFSTQLVDA